MQKIAIFFALLVIIALSVASGLQPYLTAKKELPIVKNGSLITEIKKRQSGTEISNNELREILQKYIPVGATVQAAVKVFEENGFSVKVKNGTLYAHRSGDGFENRQLFVNTYSFYLIFDKNKLTKIQEANISSNAP